jgi:hypothetical protein
MFVQVISGRVADKDALHRQLERWTTELQPAATGYLGTTAGVTADGTLLCFARFESEAAARANSDRPEQGHWWADTEKCFAETPTFEDSSDVEEWMGGGSDDAGFVQFMRAKVADRARLTELDRSFEDSMAGVRPDVIGGIRVWTGTDTYVEAVYFTSEAEARANEALELPAEAQALMTEYQGLVEDLHYFDISEPWLFGR